MLTRLGSLNLMIAAGGPAHSTGNCYISAGERFLCLILPMTDASFSCAITSVTRFIITAHSVIKLIVSTDVLSELHLKTLEHYQSFPQTIVYRYRVLGPL